MVSGCNTKTGWVAVNSAPSMELPQVQPTLHLPRWLMPICTAVNNTLCTHSSRHLQSFWPAVYTYAYEQLHYHPVQLPLHVLKGTACQSIPLSVQYIRIYTSRPLMTLNTAAKTYNSRNVMSYYSAVNTYTSNVILLYCEYIICNFLVMWVWERSLLGTTFCSIPLSKQHVPGCSHLSAEIYKQFYFYVYTS